MIDTVSGTGTADDRSAQESSSPASVASHVKDLRSRLHLTQESLARRVGVSFSTVNRWETGRRIPSTSSQARLDHLASTLGLEQPGAEALHAHGAALIVPLTPFIGRELDLAELVGLFKTTRLITLVGPGGAGKTRLATELVRRAVRPDEVVTVVSLDLVTDPADLAASIRAAADLSCRTDVPMDGHLIGELSTSPRLLLLDNCEHLVGAVNPFVETALTAAPQLRILATSRVVLDVPGEQVWSVTGLESPRPGSGPDDVGRSDAGRLFVERAQRGRPGFCLDDAGAAAVVRLCELLDGLPLALELAAAWSSTLSTSDIVARLSSDMTLLNGDDRRVGRHRSLRSVAEWSDALLGPADRLVLAQLSLFAGPFELADAERVVTGVEQVDVVHALRRLVDSSWIVSLGGDERTYGLLNTLRDFARELLIRGGDEPAARRRHAYAFTDMAETSQTELSGPAQQGWRRSMERASGDLALALDWTLVNDDDLSLRLVAALWRWWYTSGRIAEGRTRVAAALTRSRSTSPLLRARALYSSAILAVENGDYDVASTDARAARRAFEAVGDADGSSRSSTILGNVAKYRGDARAARGHLGDAVDGQRRGGDDRATAVALQNLASFVIDQGELAEGRALMEDSLSLKRRVGDRRSLGYGLVNLSDLLLREGDTSAAHTALAEAGQIATDAADARLNAFVDHNLGDLALAAGNSGRAIEHYTLAVAGFRHVRDLRDVALALCSLGRATLLAGRRHQGLALLHESEWLAEEIGDELRLSEARAVLAATEAPLAARTLPGGLTARQAEILVLLASGLSNRDIASRLALAGGTIERHLANIYTKIGVTNRVGATRYALAHGLTATTRSG